MVFLKYTGDCPKGGCNIRHDPYAQRYFEQVRPVLEEQAQVIDWWSINSTVSTTHLGDMEQFLISSDGRMAIAVLPGYFGCWEGIDDLVYNVKHSNTDKSKYESGMSSRDMMDCANSDAAKDDLGHMDAVSIPLALLVLAWRVQSLPLMLIAFIALPTGLLTSLLILGRTSLHITYPNFSPALFMPTAVAMTFDWSLFMLSRYREGVSSGRDNDTCVRDVVVYSGHTVIVSGLTLAVAFLSLVLLPVEFLQSVGKGAAITLVSCMLVNATLTPSLLLLFPRFFRWEPRCCCCCQRGRDRTRSMWASGDDGNAKLLSTSQTSTGSTGSRASSYHSEESLTMAEMRAQEKQAESRWFRLAQLVAKHPGKIVIGILLLMSPLSYMSSKLAVTVDQNQLHPRNKEAYDAWMTYRASMPSGITWPYALVAQPGPNATDSDAIEIVQRNNALISELVNVTGIPAVLFNGPTWLLGQPIDANEALEYLGLPPVGNANSFYGEPLGYYDRFRNGFQFGCGKVDPNSKAFWTEIDTPFDPQGHDVEKFVKQARQVMAKHNKAGLVTFHVALGLTEMIDVVDQVYDRLPSVLLITAGVLLVLAAMAFRSFIIALRLVFTLAVTLSWSFGSGVLVFQTSLFNFTGESMANVVALSWMAPVMTFSLIMSLGADYDIFVTTRIREYRSMGYSDEAAIVKGYYRTGGVITTAGCIMVISFGSLMLSSQMLLVECGFLLAWSVVLDTFVVRSLIVPGLMLLIGRANWWPTKMPPGTKDVSNVDDVTGRGYDPAAAAEHVALAGVKEGDSEEPPSIPTW